MAKQIRGGERWNEMPSQCRGRGGCKYYGSPKLFQASAIIVFQAWSCMLANLHRRSAGQEEQRDVRLLPGALRRHHLHHSHSAAHALLLLQPHRSLRAHLLHGVAGVHPAPRLRGEAHSRWVIMSSSILLRGYIGVRSGAVIEMQGLWRSEF